MGNRARTITPDMFGGSVFLFAERIPKAALPAHSMVAELDAYWSALQQDGRLPCRADISPFAMPTALLPWIFMMTVLRDGEALDYRYRLAGTSNVEMVGRDPTGRLASAIFAGDDRRFMLDTFHVTVAEAVPTYWQAAVPHDRYERTEVCRGIFPLADDGRTVDMLLCAAVPNRLPDAD